MNTSHWPRTRTPPSRASAGLVRSRKTSAASSPAPGSFAEPPAERESTQRRRDRDEQVGGGDDAIVGPDRPHQRRRCSGRRAASDPRRRGRGTRRGGCAGRRRRRGPGRRRPAAPATARAERPAARTAARRSTRIDLGLHRSGPHSGCDAGGESAVRGRRRSRAVGRGACTFAPKSSRGTISPTTCHLVVTRRAMSPACRST